MPRRGDRMMLYHYATKSASQYNGKMVKGESHVRQAGREHWDARD